MNAVYQYDDLDEVMGVIERCAEQACAENPDVGMDDAVHEIAKNLTFMCTPEVAKEVRRAHDIVPADMLGW